MTRLQRPADPPVVVDLTPETAGWATSGLRVLSLAPGQSMTIAVPDEEVFVLPLAGALHVDVDTSSGDRLASYALQGRVSVFTRVTDFCYAGRGSVLTLTAETFATGDTVDVALPSARCNRVLPPRYGPAETVPVEVRGGGSASRQVTNFGVPGVWDHADKLICCELITPPGNWSSYPPHKHDASAPCPVVNEEIYYYRIAGSDQVTPDRTGFGFHRTYTGPAHEQAGLASIDDLFEVRDHDAVTVPYGYHGPCIAAPGYPMYYLNVMAGPGERAMQFCDDPSHDWTRPALDSLPPDPRCPWTSTAEIPYSGAGQPQAEAK